MKEIRGNAQTVRELLKDKRYSIDYYQREYKWQDKQIQELLQDLTGRFLDDYREGDAWSKVRTYGHYFLGSVIISDKNGTKFIVDGQQRITSLTLLLIYLHNLQKGHEKQAKIQDLIVSEQYGNLAFNLDGGEDSERVPAFEALYKGEDFDPGYRSESVRNIVARYQDIEENFPDELKGEALPLFIDWLADNVHLVEITAYSDDDAYTIFETMNDRGLSLTPSDMLKGYLLANIGDPQKREAASDRWKALIKGFQDLDKDVEPDFFKTWLRSQYSTKIRERKKGAKAEDFDRIGTEFHRWVREAKDQVGLKASDDFFAFVNRDMDFYARWFMRLVQASRALTPGLEHVRYNAHHRFTLQHHILLSPLTPADTEHVALAKVRIAARYLNILLAWRIWNFRDTSYSTMQYAMFTVMRDIRGKSPSELAHLLHARLLAEDETITKAGWHHQEGLGLYMNQQNRKQLHCLLARMTDYLETQSGLPSRYEEYMAEDGPARYEVEHIWANKPARHADEFANPDEFRRHRNRIGGLLLLPKSFNASYGDLPYVSDTPEGGKRKQYLKQNLLAASMHTDAFERHPGLSRFLASSGLPLRPYDQFTKADLDERCELYKGLACQVWNPNDLLEGGRNASS